MLNILDISFLGFKWLVLGFGGGGTPMVAPLPPAPTEDPEAEAERERVRSQAVVDLAQGGRRSTISAGNTLTDEQFKRQVGSRRKRVTAADELGAL